MNAAIGVTLVAFNAFIPVTLMLILLSGSIYSGIAAMYSMHFFAMVVSPALIISFVLNEGPYYKLWLTKQLPTQLKDLWIRALVTLYVGFTIGVLFHEFVLLRYATDARSPTAASKQIFKGVNLTSPYVILSSVWFMLVNPVLEEFFWRIYLMKEIGARCGVFGSAPEVNQWQPIMDDDSPSDQIALDIRPSTSQRSLPPSPHSILSDSPIESLLPADHRDNVVEPANKYVRDIAVNGMGQMLVSALYTSYHIVVIWRFTLNLGVTVAAAGYLWLFGLMFGALRLNPRFGWVCAAALHIGLDASLIFNIRSDLTRAANK